MEARMRRYAPRSSPERIKVRTEPPPAKHQPQQQGKRVPVVYYLCRNRRLEHPHFVEVPLSSPDGLFLRDVIDKLNAQRGKSMAAMYSWSCKRSYKNGFVWHDLSEDDLILPAQGNEYVLKGSEILDQTPPDLRDHDSSNAKIKNMKNNSVQEPPISCKNQEASFLGSSVEIRIKEAKLPSPLLAQPPPPPQEDDPSSSTHVSPEPGRRTSLLHEISSPKPAELRVRKPSVAQDASTQTEDREGRRNGLSTRIMGVSTEDNRRQSELTMHSNEESGIVKEDSLPSSRRTSLFHEFSSLKPAELKVHKPSVAQDASTQTEDREGSRNGLSTRIIGVSTEDNRRQSELTMHSNEESEIVSSSAKTNTLESLIREEVSIRNNYRNVEAEEVFLSTSSKFRATNMLMHMFTCGSISVKDHYGIGFAADYKPRLADTKFTSPILSTSSVALREISFLPESQRAIVPRLNKKQHFSGSIIETNKFKEGRLEGVPKLKRSSSFNEDRSYDMIGDSSSKNISIMKSMSDENATKISPVSGARKSSAGMDISMFSPFHSSTDGSKRSIECDPVKGSSTGLESFPEFKEKVIRIEERLTSGARVIIVSRLDDNEDF